MLLALVIAVAELIERRRRALSSAPAGEIGTATVPRSPRTPQPAVTP
jgi:hypothetical protein